MNAPEQDWRSEVLTLLEGWKGEATRSDHEREIAALEARVGPQVVELAERGDTWLAVRVALDLGWLVGRRHGLLYERAKDTSGKARVATARWDTDQRRGGYKGAARLWDERKGNDRRVATDAELRTEVEARHTADPDRKWTPVCDDVGRLFGLSGRQVRNRVPDTKW